jgi:hypothetical protein
MVTDIRKDIRQNPISGSVSDIFLKTELPCRIAGASLKSFYRHPSILSIQPTTVIYVTIIQHQCGYQSGVLDLPGLYETEWG